MKKNGKTNILLNEKQQMLVEGNLGIIKHAIHKNIIVNDSIYGFEYDDLFQEGCLWLCKAAAGFDESRAVKFTTYAEKVITNGLRTYCRLMCGKQKHYMPSEICGETDGNGICPEPQGIQEDPAQIFEEQDIFLLLQNFKLQYTGTARLGIEAIEWKVKGLSGAEIAKMYGVKPNLVGAWISRASKKLRQNKMFMQYFGRIVEPTALKS